MPVYRIQTPCVIDVRADSEQDAKEQLIQTMMEHDWDEPYGDHWIYVPYWPEEPGFLKVFDVEDES